MTKLLHANLLAHFIFFFTPNYIKNSEIMFVLCDIHIIGGNWSNLQSICQAGDFWKVEGGTDSTFPNLWNMEEGAPFPDTQTQSFICSSIWEKWSSLCLLGAAEKGSQGCWIWCPTTSVWLEEGGSFGFKGKIELANTYFECLYNVSNVDGVSQLRIQT